MNCNKGSIIEYNNFAVSLIKRKRFESALPLLGTAMELAKQMSLSLRRMTTTTSRHSNDMNLDDFMRQYTFSRHVGLASSSNGSLSQQPGLIYKRGICIPTSIPFTQGGCVSVLSSILFNLGLAHQLLATEERHSQTTLNCHLEKASQMYELAYQMQQDNNSSKNFLFLMATLNNLGFAYKEMNDASTSQKCFELLLSNLVCAIDCGNENASEFESFVQNTSHLIFQHDKSSAAAA